MTKRKKKKRKKKLCSGFKPLQSVWFQLLLNVAGGLIGSMLYSWFKKLK